MWFVLSFIDVCDHDDMTFDYFEGFFSMVISGALILAC